MAKKKGSEKPKGFYKQGGRVKPITEKKGIKETSFSNKRVEDKIAVTKKTGGSYPTSFYEQQKKIQDNTIDHQFNHAVKQWKLEIDNGDTILYRNIKDPTLTAEMHSDFADDNDDPAFDGDKFWYMFPARNGKGIPNSPEVLQEKAGGYTQADARRHFKEMLVKTTNEL